MQTLRPNVPSRFRSGRLAVGLLLAALVFVPPAAVEATTPPTDAERFTRLTERIEAARVEQHIPGCAVAVVRNDEVIFAKGFGVADIEHDTPVTPETIFAIGSTTKAFTGVLIGMLIDEGVMSWDDPMTRWLPYFTPELDGDDDDVLLLRDALSHRSGFTRMSMLFVSGEVGREEILRTANDAEPFAPFREQFLYNNVMYMAAGMAAGVAAESNWETALRTHVLEPLGMKDATVTFEAAHSAPNLALGYTWERRRDDWKRATMRNIDSIGPAGSINANVLDIARWIRFQLGRGEFDGKRLLSEAGHAETWTRQMAIGGGMDYGVGWMLREWNGQQLVEHGGNIDGFAAQIAMLPDSDIGFVLLTNTGFSPLQAGSIEVVFDAMVGDWETGPASATDAEPGLDDFTGVYIANYATFENEKFTVSVEEDGRLAIDIPSQMKFAVNPPGENGRRSFADVPGIAASFDRDESGEVYMLRLYQGNLQFEVPREGYEYPVEIPLEDLEPYCGTYRFETMGVDVKVLIRNSHLAIDVPGQMVFEMHPPDDDGVRNFRNSDVLQLSARFNEAEFGAIESLTLFQAGREFVMPRLADANAEPLPTLEEVFAMAKLDARQAAVDAGGMWRFSGDCRFAQSGIKGRYTMTFDAGDHALTAIDTGRFARIRTGQDGDRAWTAYSFMDTEELFDSELAEVKRGHPSGLVGDWRRLYDEIRVHGRDDIDGTPVIIMKLRAGDLPGVTLWLDAATGDILRSDSAVELPELNNARIPVKTLMSDWHEVHGLRVPQVMVVETQQNGRFVVNVEDVTPHVEVEPGFFAVPADAK